VKRRDIFRVLDVGVIELSEAVAPTIVLVQSAPEKDSLLAFGVAAVVERKHSVFLTVSGWQVHHKRSPV
jgi:hypothetical protein